MKLGSTTLPMAGWFADPARPDLGREQRLEAIRSLVVDFSLSAVELTLDLALIYPHIFDAGFYSAVGELQQELGFACSVHLPFLWVDLSGLNEAVRQASLDSIHRALELTAPVHVESYVLHLWGAGTSLIARELGRSAHRELLTQALQAQAARSLDRVLTGV